MPSAIGQIGNPAPFWKVLSVNGAVFLIAALVLELLFGEWLSPSDFGSLNLPRNVRYRFDVSHLYAGPTRISYSRDRYGLRGSYDDPARIDILTIGGSTTNQLYIDDNATWQSNLARLFSEAGKPVTVVNAAVDGQSTVGHLAIFDRWLPLIPDLKAKYILAYVGINDVAVESAEQWDEMESPELSRKVRYWIMNKSALYNLFRTARGMFNAYEAKVVYGSPAPVSDHWRKLQTISAPVSPTNVSSERLRGYEVRLRSLVARIRKFGAEAILVTQPTSEYRLREGWVWVPESSEGRPDRNGYDTISAFNRVTMNVCRDLDAICLDLASSVEFADGDFYDRVHNTPAGTDKIGRYLFDALRPRF